MAALYLQQNSNSMGGPNSLQQHYQTPMSQNLNSSLQIPLINQFNPQHTALISGMVESNISQSQGERIITEGSAAGSKSTPYSAVLVRNQGVATNSLSN